MNNGLTTQGLRAGRQAVENIRAIKRERLLPEVFFKPLIPCLGVVPGIRQVFFYTLGCFTAADNKEDGDEA